MEPTGPVFRDAEAVLETLIVLSVAPPPLGDAIADLLLGRLRRGVDECSVSLSVLWLLSALPELCAQDDPR